MIPYVLRGGAVVIKAAGAIGSGQEAVFELSLIRCVVAADAGLPDPPADAAQVAVATAMGPLTGRSAPLRLLRLGTATFADVPAIRADMSGALSPQGAADLPRVWVGLGALGSPVARLDPSRSELCIIGAPGPVGKAERVPIKQMQGRLGIDGVSIGGQSCSMVLTTASAATVVPEALVAALKLKPIEEIKVAIPGAKAALARVYVLPELRVGKLRFTRVVALAFTPGLPGLPAGVGVIGTDLLSRVRSTWVAAEGYAILERLPDPR